MPTPVVKPLNEVVEKWAARVGVASQEYERGATGAAQRWQAAAKAGENNWKAAVAEAGGKGRFGKGIDRAGAEKFTRGVREKGSQRFAQGAQAGRPDFNAGISPVLEVIGRTDLPPRAQRGAVGNYARVQRIGEALRQFATSR